MIGVAKSRGKSFMGMRVKAEFALGSGFAGAKVNQTEASLGAQLPRMAEFESVTH